MKTKTRLQAFSHWAFIFLVSGLILLPGFNRLQAQIYEPDGLRMPGGWNGWSNSTGMGGPFDLVKINTGTPRWQTTFQHTGSTGLQEFKFVSTAWDNPWHNQWAGNPSCVIGSFFDVFFGTPSNPNNAITVTQNMWYTVLFRDLGYAGTQAIFMATSAEPVYIASVSVPATVYAQNPVTITLTTSSAPSPEEIFYLRYTTDNWATSTAVAAQMNGNTGTVGLSGYPAGTRVDYYAFSSTVPGVTSDFDMYSVRMNTNNGANYFYIVTEEPAAITFANLETPAADTIETGETRYVYGRVGIPGLTGQPAPAPGVESWVGYSLTDSDPATWTQWLPASYYGAAGSHDEYRADLGAAIPAPGLYYFATRFRFSSGPYYYGGYSTSGGGFWNGTTNISGVLTVNPAAVPFNRTLDGVTIAAEQNVCYDAKLTITANNFIVQSGGTATLIAGQNILLMPGVRVFEGGTLLGRITTNGQYCFPIDEPLWTDQKAGKAGDQADFQLYPNPAGETVQVRIRNLKAGEQGALELLTVQGLLIRKETISGNGTFDLDLDGMPSGIYLVRLTAPGENLVRKLVKR